MHPSSLPTDWQLVKITLLLGNKYGLSRFKQHNVLLSRISSIGLGIILIKSSIICGCEAGMTVAPLADWRPFDEELTDSETRKITDGHR